MDEGNPRRNLLPVEEVEGLFEESIHEMLGRNEPKSQTSDTGTSTIDKWIRRYKENRKYDPAHDLSLEN